MIELPKIIVLKSTKYNSKVFNVAAASKSKVIEKEVYLVARTKLMSYYKNQFLLKLF